MNIIEFPKRNAPTSEGCYIDGIPIEDIAKAEQEGEMRTQMKAAQIAAVYTDLEVERIRCNLKGLNKDFSANMLVELCESVKRTWSKILIAEKGKDLSDPTLKVTGIDLENHVYLTFIKGDYVRVYQSEISDEKIRRVGEFCLSVFEEWDRYAEGIELENSIPDANKKGGMKSAIAETIYRRRLTKGKLQ